VKDAENLREVKGFEGLQELRRLDEIQALQKLYEKVVVEPNNEANLFRRVFRAHSDLSEGSGFSSGVSGASDAR